MPRVSVIITTHNRPYLLPGAVESAKAAGTGIEVVVVDDASTDETASVCRGLDGIRYVRLDRNQGVAGARNVGILASQGKYISFLDDDDIRLAGSLDAQEEALEANSGAGFVAGSMIMVDQDYWPTGEVISPHFSGGDIFWALLELDFPVMGLSSLIRKECLLRVGLLNRHLNGIDDWDIFVRIAELYQVIVIDQPVGCYRRPTPSSSQGSSDQAAQLLRAWRHQLELFKLPKVAAICSSQRRAIRRRTRNRIADTLLWNAELHLWDREHKFVWNNSRTALRLNPMCAARPGAYRKLVVNLIARYGPNRPRPI